MSVIIRATGCGRVLTLVWTVTMLALIGCRRVPDQPPLGSVTGTVTLDGKPLEFVEVSFVPNIGRPSYGDTNGLGKYELTYVRNVKGAKVGKHTITVRSGKIDNSQLKPVEIKPGKNVINIECVAKSGQSQLPAENVD